MNNKVSHKSNDLAIELDEFFGKNLNKATKYMTKIQFSRA